MNIPLIESYMKLFRFLFFVFPVFALGQQLLRHLTTTEKVHEINANTNIN